MPQSPAAIRTGRRDRSGRLALDEGERARRIAARLHRGAELEGCGRGACGPHGRPRWTRSRSSLAGASCVEGPCSPRVRRRTPPGSPLLGPARHWQADDRGGRRTAASGSGRPIALGGASRSSGPRAGQTPPVGWRRKAVLPPIPSRPPMRRRGLRRRVGRDVVGAASNGMRMPGPALAPPGWRTSEPVARRGPARELVGGKVSSGRHATAPRHRGHVHLADLRTRFNERSGHEPSHPPRRMRDDHPQPGSEQRDHEPFDPLERRPARPSDGAPFKDGRLRVPGQVPPSIYERAKQRGAALDDAETRMGGAPEYTATVSPGTAMQVVARGARLAGADRRHRGPVGARGLRPVVCRRAIIPRGVVRTAIRGCAAGVRGGGSPPWGPCRLGRSAWCGDRARTRGRPRSSRPDRFQ